MEEQTTLRDTIESAMEAHTESVAEPVVESEGRNRDELGRFAPKEVIEEPSAEVAPQPVEEPVIETKVIPRPSSWKKDYETDWEVLPERIREYINEREGQYAKGVSTYKSQWDQAQPIYEAIQPFMPELQQYGIQPTTWIQNLGNAHRTLALGTPEQKMQMFAKLATDYGIPLDSLNSGLYDQQSSMVMQELTSLKNQLGQFQEEKQKQEQMTVAQEIEAFKESAPYFEEVRPIMAQLIQSGMAGDLKEAYDKAIRMDDGVWQKQQAEQAKAAEAERQKALAAKKAKAVSPRSASPTGSTVTSGGKKTLRDALSESFDAISGSI